MIRLFTLLHLLVVGLIPAWAQGEGDPPKSGDFSFLSSFFQMIAALALVVGLILLTYYLSTRLIRKIPALQPGNQHIRVLEVRAMGPRKSLVLVEVAGEYLLLASSGDQLSLIKQVPVLEDIEVVDAPQERVSFFAALKRAASRS